MDTSSNTPSGESYNAKNQFNIRGNIYGGNQDVGDKTNPVTTSTTTTYYQDSSNDITINNSYLSQMPEGFARSLVNFADQVSKQIKREGLSPEALAPLKTSANELAKATTEVMQSDVKEEEKKTTIREKLKGVAVSLVKLSPKIARAIASSTPLAPFSELIGEGFDKIIERVLQP